MANKEQQNLMQTLHDRRVQNFKNQFRSVLLEGLEIFGFEIVDDIYNESMKIYNDYCVIISKPRDHE